MKSVALIMVLCFVSPVFSGESPEQAVIRQLIEKAYVHGAFNEQNVDDMAAGFHEDFAIFGAKGTELSRYEIADWIAGIKKGKASSDYDPARAKMNHEISNIDVTGGAACARVKLYKDDKLVYTDYLSFIKFENGWKIAAKVYHRHK